MHNNYDEYELSPLKVILGLILLIGFIILLIKSWKIALGLLSIPFIASVVVIPFCAFRAELDQVEYTRQHSLSTKTYLDQKYEALSDKFERHLESYTKNVYQRINNLEKKLEEALKPAEVPEKLEVARDAESSVKLGTAAVNGGESVQVFDEADIKAEEEWEDEELQAQKLLDQSLSSY